ncbi:MAG: hypothetical protein Q9164_006539, partial [Protoblastenia rupestris]
MSPTLKESDEAGIYLKTSPAPSPFFNLPLELQLHIASYLPYPDALALKHAHPHLYTLATTNVKQKVSWLISRHERGLKCPDRKCILKTDTLFCSGENGQVRRLMEKRRRHGECKEGKGGCEVVLGRTCGGPRKAKAMAVLEDAMRIASDAKRGLNDVWSSFRLETGSIGWAILALV